MLAQPVLHDVKASYFTSGSAARARSPPFVLLPEPPGPSGRFAGLFSFRFRFMLFFCTLLYGFFALNLYGKIIRFSKYLGQCSTANVNISFLQLVIPLFCFYNILTQQIIFQLKLLNKKCSFNSHGKNCF